MMLKHQCSPGFRPAYFMCPEEAVILYVVGYTTLLISLVIVLITVGCYATQPEHNAAITSLMTQARTR